MSVWAMGDRRQKREPQLASADAGMPFHAASSLGLGLKRAEPQALAVRERYRTRRCGRVRASRLVP
jgi:hypothetical protein